MSSSDTLGTTLLTESCRDRPEQERDRAYEVHGTEHTGKETELLARSNRRRYPRRD